MSGKPTRVPPPGDMVCDLEAVRRQRGLSKADLADMAGCTRFQIHRLESATVAPTLPLALRLSKILDVAIERLWYVPSYDRLAPSAQVRSAAE